MLICLLSVLTKQIVKDMIMNWVDFILSNDAAIGTIIGLAILAGIASFMAYYFISNIMKSQPDSE